MKIFALIYTAAMAATTVQAQDVVVYSASLSGAAEVPPVETDVGGSITLMTREGSTGMLFNLKIDNPSGVPLLGAAGAHLHCGAEGENGPAITFLAPIVPGGTVSPQIDYYASFDETGVAETDCGTTIAELIEALDEGLIYANVHSEGNPGGEVRGQLAFTEDANVVSADVEMTGDNEVPPVTTNVVGEATFVYEINLNGEPDGIGFFASVTNPDAVPITVAHIHCAAEGANGPVIATLLPLDPNGRTSNVIRFRGGLVSSALSATDCGTTISEVIASMNAGNVYVNVHSTDNPSGEVRGQVPAAEVPETEAPSSSPSMMVVTDSPSASPTMTVTDAPSAIPSAAPSGSPSASPEMAPVGMPAEPETEGPTAAPTEEEDAGFLVSKSFAAVASVVLMFFL